MFNKSFISVYFLENKVFVIELSANRKTVKKYASAEIPLDIINDNKVSDKEALSKILKKLWSENGFKEKSVNLVIPEFSTFTKLLKLPNLTYGELEEAVHWQASDYLPENPETMVMDWKIVESPQKGGEGYEVLLVAVPAEILMGYVEATESAGLFPFTVSTPSVSLSNLTSNDEAGVLTIYSGYGETIMVCSKKEKIIGTSVIKDAVLSEISDTAQKMISHYKDFEVNKIFVGGLIDEKFLEEIKGKLGKEIAVLKLPLGSITKEKIQEFLIPIAVQMNKLGEPSDPRSLNLLPSYLVDKYRKDKSRIEVWSITLTITLFVWVSFTIVLVSYLIISQQITSLKSKNLEKNYIAEARSVYQKESSDVNKTAEDVLKIKSAFILPETVMNVIQNSKTPGVSLHTYNLNLDTGSVSINGISPNRVALVSFKQNLEKNPEVKSVNIPINSFENESNLEFELSFQYGNTGQKKQINATTE